MVQNRSASAAEARTLSGLRAVHLQARDVEDVDSERAAAVHDLSGQRSREKAPGPLRHGQQRPAVRRAQQHLARLLVAQHEIHHFEVSGEHEGGQCGSLRKHLRVPALQHVT